MPFVQLYPLAPEPDERDLQPCEFRKLGWIEGLVSNCEVISEVDEVIESELGCGHRARPSRARPSGEFQAEPRLTHPVRKQHAEAGPGEKRTGLLQELQRAAGVQQRTLGGGALQLSIDVRKQP